MATLPTEDEKVEMVLTAFRAVHAHAGHAIPQRNFIQVAIKLNVPHGNLVEGIAAAERRGLVNEGPHGSVRLTDAGFAAL